MKRGAVDVVLEGLDRGEPRSEPKPPGKITFARSIPIGKAVRPEVLLAYEMNGRRIALESRVSRAGNSAGVLRHEFCQVDESNSGSDDASPGLLADDRLRILGSKRRDTCTEATDGNAR